MIIGSGVTGCAVAHTLLGLPAASGLRITMLEARNAVSGATGRNGGHLVSNAAELIGVHFERLGLKDLSEIARFSEANIVRLKQIVEDLSDEDREAAELRTLVSAIAIEEQDVFGEVVNGLKAFNLIAPPTGVLEHKTITAEEAAKVCLF